MSSNYKAVTRLDVATKRPSFLLFGCLILIGGILLLWACVFAVGREFQYQNEGKVANGIVLSKFAETEFRSSSTGDRRSRKEYHYRVHYRFTTADGQVVEGSGEVRRKSWEALRDQGPI